MFGFLVTGDYFSAIPRVLSLSPVIFCLKLINLASWIKFGVIVFILSSRKGKGKFASGNVIKKRTL